VKKRIGIVVFPGSNCDRDCHHVFHNVYGLDTSYLWHQESFQVSDFDLILLPGGFSYGDYLRAGAIARFSNVMSSVYNYAQSGKPLLGICNGFQILCESGLLPGALVKNSNLLFKCETTPLQAADPASIYLQGIDNIKFSLPIAHGEGNYFIDEKGYEELVANRQIIMRYLDNPNGSYQDIAGIANRKGNVMGMMPHPERASESIIGSQDGKIILDAILQAL